MKTSTDLHGQFYGFWGCELCGYSGFLCRCEHFQRDGNVWGPDKTLTDAELAAEHWRLVIAYYRTGLEEYREQADLMLRLAGVTNASQG
jgi:hypothetical protein